MTALVSAAVTLIVTFAAVIGILHAFDNLEAVTAFMCILFSINERED